MTFGCTSLSASKSAISEAKLARKAYPAKRKGEPPKVIEGKVHRRENQPVSDSLPTDLNEAGTHDDSRARVSPALDRASNQTVVRATRGLIRLESRRRMRSLFRRLLLAMTCAGVIGCVYYFFADDLPTDLMNEYWGRLTSKILPFFEPR